MDKADKFAWKFLIEEGKVHIGWSYYGGGFDFDDALTKECLKKIKTCGVNWRKTKPIREERESAFTDTFHDSEYVATMQGTLYLNDGSEYDWGCSNISVEDIARKLFSSVVELVPDPFD